MALITIDDAKVHSIIAAAAQRADNLEPFFREWGIWLVSSTQRRFNAEVDPDGNPWKPLALSTLKAKKMAGRSKPKILQLSGLLRQSITFVASRTELQVGTPMVYGPPHQFGATISRHAQTKIGRFVRFRETQVTRADGTSYTAKRFAKASHKKIVAMARMEIGASTTVIPARPFLGLSVADMAAGQRIAKRYIAEPMGEGVTE